MEIYEINKFKFISLNKLFKYCLLFITIVFTIIYVALIMVQISHSVSNTSIVSIFFPSKIRDVSLSWKSWFSRVEIGQKIWPLASVEADFSKILKSKYWLKPAIWGLWLAKNLPLNEYLDLGVFKYSNPDPTADVSTLCNTNSSEPLHMKPMKIINTYYR